MKKVLVLTAVVVLIGSTVGCRCRWPWRRAEVCDPCAPPVCATPCPPMYAPDDSCGPCGEGGEITPGPAPYTVTPVE